MKTGNVINIQKFVPKQISEFTKEPMPFTQICNTVINNCQNPVAGFIWIYLQSKPETWNPCKWEIMKRFNISESTYRRHMKYLTATNLIETHMIRNAQGKIIDWRIVVLNGSRFNGKGDPYRGTSFSLITNQNVKFDTLEKPAPDKGSVQSVKFDTVVKKPECQNTTYGEMNTHINIRSTSSSKKRLKDNNTTSTDVEDYLVSFEKFYSVYPRKKGKQDAIKWFKKTKPNSEFVSMLIDDVYKRVAAEWNGKDLQFVPYPGSYLNGKRWEDAIETAQPVKPKFPTPDERAANEQKIREREFKAAEDKRKEIEAGLGFKDLVKQAKKHVSYKEIHAQQEIERLKLGMTVKEYHDYIIGKLKNGGF